MADKRGTARPEVPWRAGHDGARGGVHPIVTVIPPTNGVRAAARAAAARPATMELRPRLQQVLAGQRFPAEQWELIVAAETYGADLITRSELQALQPVPFQSLAKILLAVEAHPPRLQMARAVVARWSRRSPGRATTSRPATRPGPQKRWTGTPASRNAGLRRPERWFDARRNDNGGGLAEPWQHLADDVSRGSGQHRPRGGDEFLAGLRLAPLDSAPWADAAGAGLGEGCGHAPNLPACDIAITSDLSIMRE